MPRIPTNSTEYFRQCDKELQRARKLRQLRYLLIEAAIYAAALAVLTAPVWGGPLIAKLIAN